MPPCLDVYVAAARSQATIDKFLTRYADLSANLLPSSYEVWLWDLEEYVTTGTLPETIAYGLATSSRNFTLYLKSKTSEFNCVMLHFGLRGQLILGLSVEESVGERHNDAAAQRLLATLKTEFAAQQGLIGFELPPVEAEEEINGL